MEMERKLRELSAETSQQLAGNAVSQFGFGSVVGSEWTGRLGRLAMAALDGMVAA
jgi:hypothetical protein